MAALKSRIGFLPLVTLITASLSVSIAATTDNPKPKPADGVQVQKVENESVFKGLLGQLWSKLRAYGPKLSARDETQPTMIAGVRGAESTGTSLKPYWKGDRANDPAYVQEIAAYNSASQLADTGKFAQAAEAFDNFLKTYPASTLRANAQFGLGLACAGAGDKNRSLTALRSFLRENGKHPLAADANQMVKELEKS